MLPWVAWVIIVAFALLQAAVLSGVPSAWKAALRNWFDSEAGHFTLIVLIAASSAVVLMWFHIFQCVLMIGAAEMLARVELQNSNIKPAPSLGVLTGVALIGLAVGWTINGYY